MKYKIARTIWTMALSVALVMASAGGCSPAPSHSAYRPIHGYARSGDIAHVTEDLAQNPGDLNLPDDSGLTPLHLAASYCHVDVVTLLLNKGAKINITSKDGATPLHLAAQEGCADVVNLLLERGAKVNVRDKQNRTPLGRAMQWHQAAMVQLIRQHGGTD
jgi:ankyrin